MSDRSITRQRNECGYRKFGERVRAFCLTTDTGMAHAAGDVDFCSEPKRRYSAPNWLPRLTR